MSSDEPPKEEYFVCRDMLILDVVRRVLDADLEELQLAEKSYGNSWKKRGGVGAFMMLARKWDRLENQVNRHDWDVFTAIKNDTRVEGILDDIKDLRRYLLLVESEMALRSVEEENDTR